MSQPVLSVIIPNFNGVHLLKEYLPSVQAALGNCPSSFEVIIVDDGSTDESVSFLRQQKSWVRLVERPENGGFVEACNSGLAAAQGSILCFLNNDVVLEDTFFQTFSQHFRDQAVFAVTPWGKEMGSQRDLDGAKRAYWQRGRIRVTDNLFPARQLKALDGPWRSFAVQGAYFFVDGKKMRALGGFDPLFSPFLLEETDLSYRALKRGWKILFDARIRAYHRISATLSQTGTTFRRRCIAERNRMFFVWKNIHDPRLLGSHFLFLFLRLITLQPVVWMALLKAIPRLSLVLRRRQLEREEARLTDRYLLGTYSSRKLLPI